MTEVKTFIDLLKDYEICIPIIQRDYAQGRNDEKTKEVRKNLIRDIKKCLEDEKKKIDFNFVYGTISGKVFYPVDGQQRLTSLYLLHWYLNQQLDQDNMIDMNNFCYMTRNSANDFFSLLKNPNEELKSIVKESNNIKETIMNQSWFQVEWKLDPTVDAALNFLNDLSNDSVFKEKANVFFDRLNNGAIEFSFICERGDNAEINAAKSYIRMNARGKKLDSFENLKAMIDSIENNLEEKSENSFVESYDKTYVDALYSQCISDKLEGKTKEINQKSLYFLKNIYNLCCQKKNFQTDYDIVSEENQFISKIYDISQSVLSEEQKYFWVEYLDIAKTIFDYYCNNLGENIIVNAFQDKGAFIASENREIIATILYIYISKREKNIDRTNEEIEKYLYILKNLNYFMWKEELFLGKIVDFLTEVLKKEDMLDYFQSIDSESIEKLDGVLDDIKVRIKEQKIKSAIILEHGYDFYFFKDLEDKSPCRKIQYIFWISGLWTNDNTKNAELKKYMDCANKYFYNNDIEWRELFAIASNLNEKNELKRCEEINEKCADTQVWNDAFYYWDDSEDLNNDQQNQLKKIKIAYDICDKLDEIRKKLGSDDYKKCWLRYAVQYKNSVLLDKKLKWEDSKVKLINGKRYDMYVMNVTKGALYGLEKLEKSVPYEHRFEANRQYEGGLVTGDRAFIMRLVESARIDGINENLPENNCMYSLDESGIYTIYRFSGDNEYSYQEIEYDITSELHLLDLYVNSKREVLRAYNASDYLNAYAGNPINSISYVRKGTTSYWYAPVMKIENKSIPKKADKSL